MLRPSPNHWTLRQPNYDDDDDDDDYNDDVEVDDDDDDEISGSVDRSVVW